MHTIWQIPFVPIGSLGFFAGALGSGIGVLWMLPYWRSHWTRSAEVYLLSFITGVICFGCWGVLIAQTQPAAALVWQRWATVWEIPYTVGVWRAQYVVFRQTPPGWLKPVLLFSFVPLVALLLPVHTWAVTATLNPDHFLTFARGMTPLAWIIVIIAHITSLAGSSTFALIPFRIFQMDPLRRRLYPVLGIVSVLLYGSDHLFGYLLPLPWYPIGGLVGVAWIALVATEFRLHLLDDQRAIAVDALTGCLTRGYGLWQLQDTLQRRPVGVLFVDVDRFKHVNDTYGHAGGDTVLAAIGAACRVAIRQHNDAVIRTGGDEFIIAVPTAEADWPNLADRIVAQIQYVTVTWQGATWQQSLSIGRAWAPAQSAVATVIATSDQAMYTVKAQHHAADTEAFANS